MKILIHPGPPRTATTSIYAQIERNNSDRFNPSKSKEMHFFSNSGYTESGFKKTLVSEEDDRFCVDFSPTYINTETAIRNICNIPNDVEVKLLLGIRHPLEQIYSHYQHIVKTHISNFEYCPDFNVSYGFFSRTVLHSQIFVKRAPLYEMLVNRFGHENILTYNFHKDLLPESNLPARLATFLGLPKINFNHARFNESGSLPYYIYSPLHEMDVNFNSEIRILKPRDLLLVNDKKSLLIRNVEPVNANRAIFTSASWTRYISEDDCALIYENHLKEDFEQTLSILDLDVAEYERSGPLTTTMPILSEKVFDELKVRETIKDRLQHFL